MKKIFIQNRNGVNMAVVVREQSPQQGLAFVMHGLGGNKEEPHLQVIGEAFAEQGFATVFFDSTNSFNESGGDYENATITNYLVDLEDVIAWSKSQDWFQEPFVLSGHSLGGICTALFAQQNPHMIKALAPISTVVSGELSVDAANRFYPGKIEAWQKNGIHVSKNEHMNNRTEKLLWSHMIDRKRYNLVLNAQKLTMPVLLVVGSEDTSTPPDHNQILFSALPEPKQMHIIEGSGHCFRKPEYLVELKQVFLDWLKTL
jgi:dienelactone hydrolase